MRMNKSVLAAVLLGVVTVSGQCEYVAEPGPYIGAGIGYSTADIKEDELKTTVCGDGWTCVDYSDDKQDWGYKVYAGYLINNIFAVEAGYFSLGKFSYDVVGALNTRAGEAKVQGGALDLLLHLPLSESVSITARGGMTYVQVQEDYEGVGGALPPLTGGTPTEGHFDEKDVGYKYGLGLQYDISPKWGLIAEWERYHVKESFYLEHDLNLFSFGLLYRFGIEEPPPPEPVIVEKPVVVEKEVVKEVVKEVEVPAEPVVVVTPAPPAERVVLASDALFDFDKFDIKAQGRASLAELAKKLQKDDKLIITGHTDSKGSELYNLRLSQRRATAVKDYLAELGVSDAQMQTRAKGESEPVADNATEEGRAANRRVEIDIIAAPKADESE